MSTGLVLAILGAALAAALAGTGSAYGVHVAGKAAAGVAAENPSLFGRLLVLQALPGTQGIYGFLAAIMIMSQVGLLGGSVVELTTAQGWAYFGAAMPIAIAGLTSAIFQGKAAVASIHMLAKDQGAMGRGITITAIVETYAILSLLVSILLIFAI